MIQCGLWVEFTYSFLHIGYDNQTLYSHCRIPVLYNPSVPSHCLPVCLVWYMWRPLHCAFQRGKKPMNTSLTSTSGPSTCTNLIISKTWSLVRQVWRRIIHHRKVLCLLGPFYRVFRRLQFWISGERYVIDPLVWWIFNKNSLKFASYFDSSFKSSRKCTWLCGLLGFCPLAVVVPCQLCISFLSS